MTITLLIGSAFLLTIANRLYSKYSLNVHDTYALTVTSNLIAAGLFLPVVWNELPSVFFYSQVQILFILILGLLWAFAAWLINASIAQNDFSFKEIIRQTRIIIVVIAGVFFLGEELAFPDIVGIAFIIASVFIISYRRVSLREHLRSKPIILAWSSAILIAFITILEKIMVTHTPVEVYTFFAFALPGIFLLVFMNTRRVNIAKDIVVHHTKQLFIFSALMLATFYVTLLTYKSLPISLAYPIIQSATVFSVCIGTYLFEQSTHIKRKVIASAVAVAGVLIIWFY